MKLVNLPLCLGKDPVSVEASFFKDRDSFWIFQQANSLWAEV